MTPRLSEDLGGYGSGRNLTVDNIPFVRERILRAVSIFQGRGLRVPSLGRLKEASEVLAALAGADSYPDDEGMLRRIAEAVRLAQDFQTIANTLPDQVDRMAGDLNQAFKGTLEGQEPARRPFQFQTQFWFGGALARADMDPVVPSDRSKNPDFVVTPNAVSFGVEVKRPSTERGARDCIGSARDQLVAAGFKGIVVVDLSDCLEEVGLRRFLRGVEGCGFDDLIPHYRRFTDSLAEIVWDDAKQEHRPGYASIFGVWFVARGWVWDLEDLSRPRLLDMQGMHRFASSRGNVWHHTGDGFFRSMVDALRASGFAIHRVEQESRDRIETPFWEEWL